MSRIGIATLAAFASLFAGSAASACSSSSDYVAPSNFELVEMADAIGIYAPVSGSSSEDFPFGRVDFRLERQVKGDPPSTLTVTFAQMSERHRLASREGELEKPFRYHDYGGGCSRVNFDRGESCLLMLDRDADHGWQPVPDGGSRAKELYGSGSDWSGTVDRYFAIQRLDPAAQGQALAAAREDAALSPQQRADIDHHLRTASQWKPTSWLVERYERAARGEAVDILLSGPIRWALGDDPAAFLLTSLANGHHPDALPLFERLLDAPGLPARQRGLVLRYLARHALFPQAFRWIETRLLAELPTLSPRDAELLIDAVFAVQRGDGFNGPEAERWRGDPRAALVWPGLERQLDHYRATVLDAVTSR